MTQTQMTDPRYADDIFAILRSERQKSVSVREWKHRLRGYGLCLNGRHVTTLRNGLTVCELPAELSA